MESASPGIGFGFNRRDAVAGKTCRPGAGAESAGEREPSGGAENQLAGYRRFRSASLCNAEFRGPATGQRKPHFAGCRLQTRKCQHGSSGSEHNCREHPAFRHASSGSAISGKHDRHPNAASGAKSPGGRHRELRSAVMKLARIVPKTPRRTESDLFQDRGEESITRMNTRQSPQVWAACERRGVIPDQFALFPKLLQLHTAVDHAER
jgi:hypothetical protein